MAPVDVAVLGAGPAGCACAWQLGRLGLRVALLGGRRRATRLGETCGPELVRLAVAAGLDSPEEPLGPSVSHYESAWGSDALEGRNLKFWSTDEACVIERPRLETWLGTSAHRVGVDMVDECTVQSAVPLDSRWRIEGVHGSAEQKN